jgi:hypothetical protein
VLQAVGVDRLELALQRACAAHGDAQVMQELRVDVLQRPGQVVGDDLEQAVEDDRGGDVGGYPGAELERQLGARPRRGRAGRGDRLVDERDARLREAQRFLQHRLDALELAVVSAHGGRDDASAQAGVRLHVEADDGLLIAVEDAQRDLAAAHFRDRNERAHLDHVLQPLAQRVGERVVEEPRLGLGLRGRERLAGRAVAQDQRPVAVAQRQTFAVQATVERVVERRRAGTDGTAAHIEVLFERGAGAVQIGAFGEEKLHLIAPVCHAR